MSCELFFKTTRLRVMALPLDSCFLLRQKAVGFEILDGITDFS